MTRIGSYSYFQSLPLFKTGSAVFPKVVIRPEGFLTDRAGRFIPQLWRDVVRATWSVCRIVIHPASLHSTSRTFTHSITILAFSSLHRADIPSHRLPLSTDRAVPIPHAHSTPSHSSSFDALVNSSIAGRRRQCLFLAWRSCSSAECGV